MIMSNEEFERKMAFIVNQQTRFAVEMEKMRDKQVETDKAIDRLVAAHAKFDEGLISLTAKQAKTEEVVTRLAYVTNVGFKETEAKINSLIDAQIRTEEAHARTEEAQARTQEAQARTEEALKGLANSQKKTDEEFRKLIIRLDRRSNNGGNTD